MRQKNTTAKNSSQKTLSPTWDFEILSYPIYKVQLKPLIIDLNFVDNLVIFHFMPRVYSSKSHSRSRSQKRQKRYYHNSSE